MRHAVCVQHHHKERAYNLAIRSTQIQELTMLLIGMILLAAFVVFAIRLDARYAAREQRVRRLYENARMIDRGLRRV
jgi:hypothetical protein